MALHRRPPAGNVRRVQTHGKGTWGTMVNQMHETMQFETNPEKLVAFAAIRNKGVRRITSQPLKISFTDDDGKSHTYTPDFLVLYWDGSIEIHEFSMEERRLQAEIRRREEAGRKFCAERGWHYIVHTERDLPSETEETNIKVLRQYSPSEYFDPQIAVCILFLLTDGARVPICELASQVVVSLSVPQPWVYSTMLHMLWHGQLLTNLKVLLIMEGTPNPRAIIWSESR